jgi:hypothetical protein
VKRVFVLLAGFVWASIGAATGFTHQMDIPPAAVAAWARTVAFFREHLEF